MRIVARGFETVAVPESLKEAFVVGCEDLLNALADHPSIVTLIRGAFAQGAAAGVMLVSDKVDAGADLKDAVRSIFKESGVMQNQDVSSI